MSPDPARGVDRDPSRRPGVPAERAPQSQPHAGNVSAMRQEGRPTGAGEPPHGLSGRLRATAYRIPDHFARHWMLLIVADRVELMEYRLRTQPGAMLALGAGAIVGTVALTRALGRR